MHETAIPGVYRFKVPTHPDPRGSLRAAWVRADLSAAGLDAELAQVNLATNPTAGTLRGLHFQTEPFSEVKVVQVISGAICDVVVDLRRGSPTFAKVMTVTLEAAAHEALYLPKGMAHGYQTLVPDTTVLYMVSAPFSPAHQAGLRWSDPALAIQWPMPPTLMSERDRELPFLSQLDTLPGAADRGPLDAITR